MSNSWVYDLETKVYTIVKKRALETLEGTYPTINFTTSESVDADVEFPTVLIYELPGPEAGRSTESSEISGVLKTDQIKVFTNTGRSDARYILQTIIEIYKELNFEANSLIEVTKDSDVYCALARVRRYIGSHDTL